MKNEFTLYDVMDKSTGNFAEKTEWKYTEAVVECVLYNSMSMQRWFFVNIVEPYYTAMVKEIEW